VEQRVLVTVKDAICFMKDLGEILASQTLHPSIEKPMINGQAELPPDRNPSCVAAEQSGQRLAWAVLESMDAIKPDAVVYPSWNNPPH
jgi:amidase